MNREEILAHPPRYLKQAQREFFHDQGYLAPRGLIGEQDLNPLRTALAKVIDASRTVSFSSNKLDLEMGHTADTPRLHRLTYLEDIAPVFWELCSNSVIPDIAADLLGPNIRFRELMANFKWAGGGAEVKWHQDIAFYPHTNVGTCQFLMFLEDVDPEQRPLQVIPGSHQGPIFEHYDANQAWTGAIDEPDLYDAGLSGAVELTGKAGTVSVHHSCTVHGSSRNLSSSSRPVSAIAYDAADAYP